MKTVLSVLLTFAAIQPAFSSDRFTNEIVCSTVLRPGEADTGVDVLIQSNPTAWVRKAVIKENGYAGPRVIGDFQIPLDQPKVSTPSYFNSSRIAVYAVEGFELKMAVADSNAKKVLGPAEALIKIPGYAAVQLQLTCKRVK